MKGNAVDNCVEKTWTAMLLTTTLKKTWKAKLLTTTLKKKHERQCCLQLAVDNYVEKKERQKKESWINFFKKTKETSTVQNGWHAWMLSLIQVGHWSLAGSSQPGVSQTRPSILRKVYNLCNSGGSPFICSSLFLGRRVRGLGTSVYYLCTEKGERGTKHTS